MKFSSVFTRLKGTPSVALLAIACSAFGGVASAAPFTWSGSGTNDLWNTAANWTTTGSSGPAVTGSNLVFSGQNRTTSTNNLTLATGSISFANTSPTSTGFVLTGSNLSLNPGARITTAALSGSGTVQEEIATNLLMGGALTLTATGGSGRAHNLLISGNIGNGAAVSGNGVTIGSGSNSAQVILSGNNTNNGVYTVNSGAILTTLGTSALNNQSLTANGTVNVNGSILKVGPLSGTGTVTTTETGARDLDINMVAVNANFNGSITDGSGTLSLLKSGSGNQTLNGANTYTGATTINAGGLTLGSNGSISGTSVVSINNDGALNYGRTGATSFDNVLNGSGTSGSFNITTDSVVGIGSSGDFGGTINTGSSTATFTGSLGAATVNVGVGGNLYGTGTVGNVNLDGSAGTVSAGLAGAVGQLNVGSLTAVTSAESNALVTRFDIVGSGSAAPLAAGVAGTDYDTIVGTGTIDYGAAGSNLVFDFSGSTGDAYGNWTQFQLLNFAGYTNGTSLDVAQLTTVGNATTGLYEGLTFTTSGGNGIFVADAGNGQTVEFYAATGVLMIVPEPSSIILAGLGVGLAGFRTWRNRRLKAILNRAGSQA
jgi:hypothetical protein